jgi:hypothetical protein
MGSDMIDNFMQRTHAACWFLQFAPAPKQSTKDLHGGVNRAVLGWS